MLFDFQGCEYGTEYLNLIKGDIVVPLLRPVDAVEDGWAYGIFHGKHGWYPIDFVANV